LKIARAREGFGSRLDVRGLDLFDRLLIDAGRHDRDAHDPVER